VAWMLLQVYLEVTDWTVPHAYELFWILGLLSVPSLLALLLAALGRGLGWAISLCVVYAMVCLFFLSISVGAVPG